MFSGFLIAFRQINMERTVLSLGGIDKITLDDHVIASFMGLSVILPAEP